jgi:hypothetical protein
MRKLSIFIVMLCLLFYAGAAQAEAIMVFGDADVDIALPGKNGKRLCITRFQYDADSAGDDITFYGSSGDRTTLSGDEAIGQTVFAAKSGSTASGIGTTSATVLQKANGQYAEYGLLASYTALAPTWTAATVATFYAGDELIEMDLTLQTFSDVGTAAASLTNPNGLFCGPPNSPILAIGSAGVWFEIMTGFYVDNESLNAPVGAFLGSVNGAAGGILALPGKKGARIVVTGIGADLVGADDDIDIYTWSGLSTGTAHYTADEAVGQTTLSASADPGFSDTSDVYVISQRSDGSYAEMHMVSQYVAGGDMTSTAIRNSFKKNDLIYETKVLRIADDWLAAAYLLSNDIGLFTGPIGSPIGIVSVETDGILDYIIGYHEAAGGRKTLATMIPDDTATGAIGAKAALPGFNGKRTTIGSFSYDPTTASTDELFMYTAVQPWNSAVLTEASAAGDTSLVWSSREGADNIANTAYIVLQRPDGTAADLVLLSDATITTGTATANHVTQSYPVGSLVFEMETNAAHFTLTDPVADAATVYSNPNGLFSGPLGSPLALRIAGADSQIEYMTGFAE